MPPLDRALPQYVADRDTGRHGGPRAGAADRSITTLAVNPIPNRAAEKKTLRSNADNLRQVIEVLVSCMQEEVVLEHQSGQPHIVRRNRRALFAELAED